MNLADRLVADASRWQRYWDRISGVDRAVLLDIEQTEQE